MKRIFFDHEPLARRSQLHELNANYLLSWRKPRPDGFPRASGDGF